MGQRPVVLVGHSLGGLVLQQVCLQLDRDTRSRDAGEKQRAAQALKRVLGAVFYSTPKAGSRLADLTIVCATGPLMRYLRTSAWRRAG